MLMKFFMQQSCEYGITATSRLAFSSSAIIIRELGGILCP